MTSSVPRLTLRKARARRILLWSTAALLAAAVLAFLSVYLTLCASLPQLDGDLQASQIRAPLIITRDAHGAPTVRARSRRDLAFGTGVVHGQDRFFQMDLLRRAAAGELAELFGATMLEADRRLRVHQFKRVAHTVFEQLAPDQRELLVAYAAGVNYALKQMDARPWEYLLLQSQPRDWVATDTVLVGFAMYLDLNDSTGEREYLRGELRRYLPAELFQFLHPTGTEWDAPLMPGRQSGAPIPSAAVINLRAQSAHTRAVVPLMSLEAETAFVGSNSWAVAGTRTRDGAALLANDMHLGLRVPHIWYRARLIVSSDTQTERDLVGVTLPGSPFLVVGSNKHVAWSFTNSYGDFTDLIALELDPQDRARYLTPDGTKEFVKHREVIHVRGGTAVSEEIRTTIWGPVVSKGEQQTPFALAWTAHRPQATNLGLIDLENARTVEEAFDIANRSGIPVQNFVAVDHRGNIGWTLMGRVPAPATYDRTVPVSWSDANIFSWRAPHEYPRLINPLSGRIWTANARVIDAASWLQILGDGGYDLGARASQIRDGLFALEKATTADMLKLQLDDRALFLTRWRDLLLQILDAPGAQPNDARRQTRRILADWSGRADVDDVAYRLVRTFRLRVRAAVFESLIARARRHHPNARFEPASQFEGPLWQLVTDRPLHLLDARFQNWEHALLSWLDDSVVEMQRACGTLKRCTWGKANILEMRHPLAAAVPLLGRWVDMPAAELPGDVNMPRVQGVRFGASERLIVSPGQEDRGYFQMPAGQSGHPLSPFYASMHSMWVTGEAVPLLPGKPQHELTLKPLHHAP